MDSLSVSQSQAQPRRRRHFPRQFKARIVAACQEPGVSVSRIVLDNQLNANLLRRWIREAEQADRATTSPAFRPLHCRPRRVGPSSPEPTVSITASALKCPARRTGHRGVADRAGRQCLALLRELLR